MCPSEGVYTLEDAGRLETPLSPDFPSQTSLAITLHPDLGRREEAIPYLQWVKENGNQNFAEYAFALSELEHRSNSNIISSRTSDSRWREMR
jgi:hypothetical protein